MSSCYASLRRGRMSTNTDKKAYVYIVKCADDTLYCGFAYDVNARLAVHNIGKGAKYTRARLPVKLVYSEICENQSAALKREREIKKLNRAMKIKLCEKYIADFKNDK